MNTLDGRMAWSTLCFEMHGSTTLSIGYVVSDIVIVPDGSLGYVVL